MSLQTESYEGELAQLRKIVADLALRAQHPLTITNDWLPMPGSSPWLKPGSVIKAPPTTVDKAADLLRRLPYGATQRQVDEAVDEALRLLNSIPRAKPQ